MNILTLHTSPGVYLVTGALLFALGVYGMVRRRSLIGMLIAAELILAGASVNFMTFSRFLSPSPATGQIVTLFVMAVAAAEVAITLSIIIAVYRNYRSIDAEDISELKG